MKFSKEFLQETVLYGPCVLDEITDHKRWSVCHRRVFEHEGKFYETTYSVAATEGQSEQPYEYDKEEIECPEVVPVQRTVTVYERPKQ